MSKADELREQILQLIGEYYNTAFSVKKDFEPGDRISYAARVFDQDELINLVDASLDFWLTAGKYCNKFESTLAEFLDVKYCSLCNSGSSANLLAVAALTSPLLNESRIKPGDEIITVAAAFPTTIAPAVQYGIVPVFVDVTIPQYNIDCSQLERALSTKTKAVMIAHTMGNPFDLSAVKTFCDAHSLWLIEDNCDALGSRYYKNGEWKYTGTIGHIGTSSFYPPHHVTMGEGGAVYTNDGLLHRIVNSLRDWGRDCQCPPGVDNICGHRFNYQFGQLPPGYDHKYVYSHFGYNLKATEMQGAIGCAQIKKLPIFITDRKKNWNLLWEGLKKHQDRLILPKPAVNSDPSWFGFMMTVNKDAGFIRNEIVRYLENHNIQTRNLFAGNILKHPCFSKMLRSEKGYRVVGDLKNTDRIMNDSFWIGVYPGLSIEMISYMIDTINSFMGA